MARGITKVYWFECVKCKDTHEFVAVNWMDAIKQARENGWDISAYSYTVAERCKECGQNS